MIEVCLSYRFQFKYFVICLFCDQETFGFWNALGAVHKLRLHEGGGGMQTIANQGEGGVKELQT